MFEAHEDALLGPGTWRLWTAGPPPLVFIACPQCGEILLVERDLNPNGTAPFQCPKNGCGFHSVIKLVGLRCPT